MFVGLKEKLDPYWHKSRVAARIWLKAQKKPLNARDRRLARLFAEDRGVTNRLICQGVSYWVAPYGFDENGNRKLRVCYVKGHGR